ncbi:MAG: hypothetical protein LBD12_01195 [Clostridiales Family XIII bacterium]|nr:hypothetical protein [Clostridiales Family XIII bacterium]
MDNKLNIKSMFVIAGAYASYTIGAGFASGNEILQFFGSWGLPWAFLAMIVGLVFNAYFCASAYRAGQLQNFAKSRDVYAYYCGPYIAWVFDIFVILFVLGIFATMFTGAGSMVNQFVGLPQWVGSVIVGAIAAVTVFGGLKIVEKVLGYAGIVIIGYVIVLGIVSLFHPSSSFEHAAEVEQQVAEGHIWQAGFYGISNWWFDGLCYAGVCLIVSVPFIASLGKSTKGTKDAIGTGIFSGIFFYLGAGLVAITLLANFDAVVGTDGNMLPIPTLAAIQKLFPAIAWTYMVVLIAGIYTTVTGYLWLLTDRVFGSKPSIKSRIFAAVLMVIGIVLGSVLPFSWLVNMLYPLSGFAGILFGVFMLVKDIRMKVAKKEAA